MQVRPPIADLPRVVKTESWKPGVTGYDVTDVDVMEACIYLDTDRGDDSMQTEHCDGDVRRYDANDVDEKQEERRARCCPRSDAFE